MADEAPGAATRRVAVDVGGTFIDLVMVDEAGEPIIEKQPATSDALAREVVEGLGRLPRPPSQIEWLLHGSTVVLNAVLQGRGATVGLITTKGFRDVLELGRGNRPNVYDWMYVPPDPLVPRHRRREVPERMTAAGTELVALDVGSLDREVDALVADGVDAIAICFLHAYANPAHEQAAAARTRRRHPELFVTASADAAAEWREFERTQTAVLNAFVQPSFAGYLEELSQRLLDAGHDRSVAIMQSNGGVVDARRAGALPIRTLLSGPAGGAIGARELLAELGVRDAICTDVGGTSFDVLVIQDGEIAERTEASVGGRPVLAPFFDIVSVGAGGGSLAWIDETGAPRVGPASAGARPGPACFGLGGAEPTVTDAQLLLGRIDPANFLGARMRLDVGAAERAVVEHLAAPLGIDLEEAATGVVVLAEATMAQAIHAMTVERGVDPRELTLLSYGGAGGLFAAATARELDIGRIVIPRAPANFSAWGILSSDYREDAALTRVRPLSAKSVSGIQADLRAVAAQVAEHLVAHGFSAEVRPLFRLDARFEGQEHTITVPVEAAWVDAADALLAGCRERFAAMHRTLFGHGELDASIEIVTARCRGVGRVTRPRWAPWRLDEPAAPAGSRPVAFPGEGRLEAAVYARDLLALEQVIAGPAIVEEWTTTIVIPPAWSAQVDVLGDLVLERP